jgi:hypothetical protein
MITTEPPQSGYILSKPVRRWEALLDKWLGFTGMLSLYLLLMARGVIPVCAQLDHDRLCSSLRGPGLDLDIHQFSRREL